MADVTKLVPRERPLPSEIFAVAGAKFKTLDVVALAALEPCLVNKARDRILEDMMAAIPMQHPQRDAINKTIKHAVETALSLILDVNKDDSEHNDTVRASYQDILEIGLSKAVDLIKKDDGDKHLPSFISGEIKTFPTPMIPLSQKFDAMAAGWLQQTDASALLRQGGDAIIRTYDAFRADFNKCMPPDHPSKSRFVDVTTAHLAKTMHDFALAATDPENAKDPDKIDIFVGGIKTVYKAGKTVIDNIGNPLVPRR